MNTYEYQLCIWLCFIMPKTIAFKNRIYCIIYVYAVLKLIYTDFIKKSIQEITYLTY